MIPVTAGDLGNSWPQCAIKLSDLGVKHHLLWHCLWVSTSSEPFLVERHLKGKPNYPRAYVDWLFLDIMLIERATGEQKTNAKIRLQRLLAKITKRRQVNLCLTVLTYGSLVVLGNVSWPSPASSKASSSW